MSTIQDQQQALESAEAFLHKAFETKKVWALKHADGGWASCESSNYEQTVIFLFWSDAQLAEQYHKSSGEAYEVIEFDLETFIEAWLKGLDQDDHMVGLNWQSGLYGLEVEPLDIAKKLRSGDI